MGPYAGVDYNLTLYVPSRVDSNTFYHGQTYAMVDLNPMPESTLSPALDLASSEVHKLYTHIKGAKAWDIRRWVFKQINSVWGGWLRVDKQI